LEDEMIYATAAYGKFTKLFCIDEAGERAFPLNDFFKFIYPEPGKDLPWTMTEFIEVYKEEWTDLIAEFYGSRPNLAINLKELAFRAPIPSPLRNIVCFGKNYQAHAEELKGQIFSDKPPTYPIYFTKPNHTVIGTGDTILPHKELTQKLDYEVELAVIIGKSGIDIPRDRAEEYIFGYTVANDVSARDLQHNHTQWYKGKSLMTHCPMGPWIVHKSALPLPLELNLRSCVNHQLRQEGNTRDMIFDIPAIISDLSRGYELRPGDIILTGTPAGVGMGFDPPRYLMSGDQITCQIEGVGILTNIIGD
jgi:2-keto-4-pentenoate hydratase/2-oxohepta-3-ene-1,7-dioic acid hydratase in catechol pathway